MADIASLGIRVTTQGVPEAERSLQSLAKAGGNAATSVQRLAKDTEGALRESGKTWRQFVGERMGDYMRLEGGHAGAMKRIAAEWKDYKAGLAGVGAAATQAAPAARALSEGLGKVAPAMQQAARSTKELRAATWQLPMQFTDIVTSLASGQRPLQVLMQQGGQLKDMFGGIGPAARAMGGYIAGLINPVTLAGAAIVGLGVAWKEATDEADAFNRALVTSGASSRLSVRDLRDMADALDASTNATAGKASEVLTQAVAGGRIAADQLKLAAEAALNLEDATGRAADKTLEDFARIQAAPVEYALKLNEAGGVLDWLTQETLDNAKAFEEQGRTADAARVIAEAYAKSINDRSAQITGDLSLWAQFWRNVKSNASEAFDGIIEGFRRSAEAQAGFIGGIRIALLTSGTPLAALAGLGQGRAPATPPAQSDPYDFLHTRSINPLADAKVDSATERARQEFDRAGLRYATERQRMEREIADARKQGAAAGASDLQIEQRIAAIRASYAKKGGTKRERKSDEGRAREQLDQRFTSQNASLEREIALFGDRSRAAAAAYDAQASGLDKVNPKLAESLQANAKWLDQLDDMKAIEGVWADISDEYADANQRKAESLGQLTDDMQFEIDLLGKSAIEQARMIAIRRAGVDAASAEGQEIIRLSDAYVRLSEQQRLLDDVRGSTEDMFASFIDGSKSASEAFEDFAKDLQRIAARLLAQKAVEWLINGMFGNSGPNVQAASGGGYTGPTGVWEFASGGYTGPGGQFEPAGVVHKGEVVWSQQDVARAGGVGVVEAMRLGRRGYAAGGVVGGAAAMGGGIRDIVINTPPGSTARTEQRDAGDGSGARDLIVFIENTAKQAVASDIARGGMIAKAGQMAYGWQRQGVSRG